jgi:hypothetical protein
VGAGGGHVLHPTAGGDEGIVEQREFTRPPERMLYFRRKKTAVYHSFLTMVNGAKIPQKPVFSAVNTKGNTKGVFHQLGRGGWGEEVDAKNKQAHHNR